MSDQEKQQPPTDPNAQANTGQRSERGGRDRKGRRRNNISNRPLEESVNMDELREIVELISENGFTDFELENKDVRIRLRRDLTPQIVTMPGAMQATSEAAPQVDLSLAKVDAVTPSTDSAPASVAQEAAGAETAAATDDDLYMIPSPIVGTFFRSPSPTADPFVGIGSHVGPDSVVCIIEAMKLMNEIQAETSGVVVKIYVENGQPVEFGQPLFGVKK